MAVFAGADAVLRQRNGQEARKRVVRDTPPACIVSRLEASLEQFEVDLRNALEHHLGARYAVVLAHDAHPRQKRQFGPNSGTFSMWSISGARLEPLSP